MNSIDSRIQELERELTTLKQKKEQLARLSVPQQLAIWLHDNMCTLNHVDQCGWFYEVDTENDIHRWDQPTRARYLDTASAMLSRHDINTIMSVLTNYKNIK